MIRFKQGQSSAVVVSSCKELPLCDPQQHSVNPSTGAANSRNLARSESIEESGKHLQSVRILL